MYPLQKKIVSSTYLGLHIDSKLNFHNHIDNLESKLSQLAGASYRLKNFLNLHASKCFYYSCIYSLITYCLPVYGAALSSSRGRMLSKLHDKIVKNLFLKYSPNECPYKTNKILKIGDVYKLLAGIHMYKVINGENESLAETIVIDTSSYLPNKRSQQTSDSFSKGRSNPSKLPVPVHKYME